MKSDHRSRGWRQAAVFALLGAVLLALGWWSLPTPRHEAAGAGFHFQLVMQQGVLSGPAVLTALQGQALEIELRSDEAGMLHLHGYELLQPVVAGGTTRLRFTAQHAGRFALELHPAERIVATLEIYPQ